MLPFVCTRCLLVPLFFLQFWNFKTANAIDQIGLGKHGARAYSLWLLVHLSVVGQPHVLKARQLMSADLALMLVISNNLS